MPQASSDEARRTLIGVFLVIAAAIGFSARGVIIKLAYPYGVDAVTLLALRMIFSLPLFLIMAYFARQSATPLTRSQWTTVLALGFIGYYLSSLLSFLALVYIPASLERLLIYLTPTIVVTISALMLKSRVRRHHVAALVVTYCGILLVMADNLAVTVEPSAVLVGSALAFTSALTYAVYLIASGTIIPGIGSARFTAYGSGIACGFVIAHFLIARDLESLLLPWPVYVYGATMAVFCTVVPTWMMAEGIRRIGANQSSMLSAIGPVATITLAATLLDEAITVLQLGGVILVLAGVWLVGSKREAAAQPSPPAPTR